ncbi:hypothetical protein FHS55_004372 [Angulomicrobium tetraedrale]|uniref:Uncharacterized protein n=1 Tax=Ancylobacter tetraedralis TaxID=217068 RepID=A0A839ZGD5_9HYPH|nr:hypothetical protein [Ancylobacter tetraedralis]MBB3773728.1 hypothetical protein [Ancylobacter tetraedralis]
MLAMDEGPAIAEAFVELNTPLLRGDLMRSTQKLVQEEMADYTPLLARRAI